jgi:hypothetical protein
MTKFKKNLCFCILPSSFCILLAGCASFNANTFNAENLAADAANTATHALNQYYPTATNGATAAQIAKLTSMRDEIYAVDRDLSKALTVLNKARLDYVANAADTNKTAVIAALQTVSDQSGNIVSLVKTFMPVAAPAKAKVQKVPSPDLVPIPVSSATN